MRLNRKYINEFICLIPVSSKIIGYPRKQSPMYDYVKRFPTNRILKHQSETIPLDKESVPSVFKAYRFQNGYELFTSVLKDGRVWGRNGAVITDEDYFIPDVSREFNSNTEHQHSVFYTLKQKKATYFKGNLAVIGTAGANIYYHWMLDILPRIGLLNNHVSLASINFFITEFTGLPFQKESLQFAGVETCRILRSNENWKFHIQAEKLWVPSLAGALGQPNAFQVSFLRSLFQKLIYKGRPFRKIYISRARTGRRMIQNESEIIPVLETFGFELVHCEEISLAEQVKIFSESAIVIGSHGSAFTNLVFCNAGTKVLEIFNQTHVEPCFWMISVLRSLQYFYLQGDSMAIDNNPKNDNTIIAVELFKDMLLSLIKGN